MINLIDNFLFKYKMILDFGSFVFVFTSIKKNDAKSVERFIIVNNFIVIMFDGVRLG